MTFLSYCVNTETNYRHNIIQDCVIHLDCITNVNSLMLCKHRVGMCLLFLFLGVCVCTFCREDYSYTLFFCLSSTLCFFMNTTPHTPLHLFYLQSFVHKDCDVQYAVLDTAALASSPRSSVYSCGDLVEYATIQPSSH